MSDIINQTCTKCGFRRFGKTACTLCGNNKFAPTYSDLLAACKVAEDVLSQLLDKHGGEGDQWNGLAIVREAIAKATPTE